jgi:predicted MFS family arabinose efflux permease
MQVTAIIAIGVTYFYKRRALITGLVSFAYGIGAVVGPLLTAILLNSHGWRMPFIVFGAVGIAFIILIQFGIKSWFSEIDPAKQSESEAFHGKSDLRYDGSTIWNPVTVLLSLATICAGITAFGFFGLFPLYLRNGLGFSPTQAAAVLGLIGIGGFTAPIGGWIGDRIGYYKVLFVTVPVMGLSAGLSYTALGGSVFWHAFFALIQGIAVIGVLYANLSAVIIKSMNRDKSGTASGMFVSSYYIPAAFAGYLVGWLKDMSDWTTAGMTVSFGFAAISVTLLFIAYTIQGSAGTRAQGQDKVSASER